MSRTTHHCHRELQKIFLNWKKIQNPHYHRYHNNLQIEGYVCQTCIPWKNNLFDNGSFSPKQFAESTKIWPKEFQPVPPQNNMASIWHSLTQGRARIWGCLAMCWNPNVYTTIKTYLYFLLPISGCFLQFHSLIPWEGRWSSGGGGEKEMAKKGFSNHPLMITQSLT